MAEFASQPEVTSTEPAAEAPKSKNYQLACVHEEMNPRRRNTMEDCHRIIPNLLGDDDSISYFGVYDGHGGRHIVDFLEEGLETNVRSELQNAGDAGVVERLASAFLITDMQSRRLDITTSGSTAIVALIKNNTAEDGSLTRTLYCANVGDSRAVLVCDSTDEEEPEESTTGFYGRRLSHDHKADDAGEIQRIKAAGGFVARSRVLGILAVSRSFGDHGMKDFVIADPYVTETILGATDSAPMLILACDGVWDVFSDQEACDFLMEKYKEKGGPFDDAAKLLVDESIERGSADNITVIVIFL